MGEAVDSEISVTDAFELTTDDDNTSFDTLITTPLSPSRGNSHRSIPLVTFSSQKKDHEDDNSETINGETINGVKKETNGVTPKIKHTNKLYSDLQERVQTLNTTENLVTMIKVRSVLVLFGIICSVIVLFQIPIVLYYTDPPTVDLFTLPEVDIGACSVRPCG